MADSQESFQQTTWHGKGSIKAESPKTAVRAAGSGEGIAEWMKRRAARIDRWMVDGSIKPIRSLSLSPSFTSFITFSLSPSKILGLCVLLVHYLLTIFTSFQAAGRSRATLWMPRGQGRWLSRGCSAPTPSCSSQHGQESEKMGVRVQEHLKGH